MHVDLIIDNEWVWKAGGEMGLLKYCPLAESFNDVLEHIKQKQHKSDLREHKYGKMTEHTTFEVKTHERHGPLRPEGIVYHIAVASIETAKESQMVFRTLWQSDGSFLCMKSGKSPETEKEKGRC